MNRTTTIPSFATLRSLLRAGRPNRFHPPEYGFLQLHYPSRSYHHPGFAGNRSIFLAPNRKSLLLSSKRRMVMVTQTQSSDLPPPESSDNSSHSNAEYKYESQALAVTPSCVNRIETLISHRKSQEHENDSYFLRVFVDAGGCSGFQYQFEIDNDLDEEEDIVIVSTGDASAPRVVVDETSLGFLEGSTLDYVQEMIKSAFVVVDNPKSESACGCGSSFAVKNFDANPAVD